MVTVPLSGTNIRLLSGIPFTNDYKNSRWFDNLTSQTNYFLSKNVVHSILEANFQRIEGLNFISVNESIDDLWNVNYIMFQNTSYNNKWFYAFVTKLEYKQRKTTYVHFEIDVLQTWLFNYDFKPSFVVREHCDLWNADGSPVINTVDEGLNYGTDYNVVSVENYRPCDGVYFMVAVCKQGMHGTINKGYYASLNGLPQLLVYYIHPFKLDGSVPSTNLGSLSSISDFLGGLYTQDNAVNNIVSIYVTDALPNNPILNNGSLSFDTTDYENVSLTGQVNGTNVNTIFVKDMNYSSWIYDNGDKYNGYSDVSESKLLMHPYTVLELVDFRGNKITYKNEYIQNPNLLISIQSSLGLNNKIVYSLKDYLTGQLIDDGIKTKASLENSLINSEPNDIPVLTDYLSAYLQGNRNSIQNQKNSIQFNGLMNTIGSAVGGVAAGMSGNAAGVAQSAVGAVQGTGNAILELQGINAKIKDIDNTPPTLTKMGSNTYFDYGHKYTGIWIIKKEITPEYRKKLTDFFNMFGYKKNEVKVPNFHTRKYWNYVQTLNCYITGDMNNNDLQKIKNIFDNGITLWHTDSVGSYSLVNEVIG